jgi:hypothetical protein
MPQQVLTTAGDDDDNEPELDAEELAEMVADMLVERIEMKEPIRPAKRRR